MTDEPTTPDLDGLDPEQRRVVWSAHCQRVSLWELRRGLDLVEAIAREKGEGWQGAIGRVTEAAAKRGAMALLKAMP